MKFNDIDSGRVAKYVLTMICVGWGLFLFYKLFFDGLDEHYLGSVIFGYSFDEDSLILYLLNGISLFYSFLFTCWVLLDAPIRVIQKLLKNRL